MSEVEQVTEPCAEHGEGPVWHPGWPGLRWVDMLAGDVLTLDSRTGSVDRSHVGSVVAALRPRRDGGAVLALERGFALADDTLGDVQALGELWTDPGIRMNEGGCDPDGRVYCGSMSYQATPGAGTLYRMDTERHVEPVLREVTISNGIAWSPDGSIVYYVDTPTQCVDAFDYDSGALTQRRTIIHVDAAHGSPDGLTVDSEGGIWAAMWGGGAVHHYTPHGVLADVIPVPAPRVTACTFGGPDLNELYITTSRLDTDTDAHPEAGAVFRVSLPVQGAPAAAYGS